MVWLLWSWKCFDWKSWYFIQIAFHRRQMMRFKHEKYSNIPQNSWKKKHFYFFLLFLSLRHDKINLKINVLYLQNFPNSVLWNVTKCNTLGYQKSWGNYLKTSVILSNSKFSLSQPKKSHKFRTDRATFENEANWMAKISKSFWFSSKKWPILIFLG